MRFTHKLLRLRLVGSSRQVRKLAVLTQGFGEGAGKRRRGPGSTSRVTALTRSVRRDPLPTGLARLAMICFRVAGETYE